MQQVSRVQASTEEAFSDWDARTNDPSQESVTTQGHPMSLKKVNQFAKYCSLLKETPKLDFYVKSDFWKLAMN